MRTHGRKLARAAFGAAVALTLGFGATQALAAPPTGEAARRCDLYTCNEDCIGQGYAGGVCRLMPLRCECTG